MGKTKAGMLKVPGLVVESVMCLCEAFQKIVLPVTRAVKYLTSKFGSLGMEIEGGNVRKVLGRQGDSSCFRHALPKLESCEAVRSLSSCTQKLRIYLVAVRPPLYAPGGGGVF